MEPLFSWSYKLTGNDSTITCAPLIVGELCVIGESTGAITCLNLQDGRVVWQNELPGRLASATLWNDSFVLFGTLEESMYVRQIYCVSIGSGEICWSQSFDRAISSCLTTVGDELLFGSYDNSLHCLSLVDRREVFRVETGDAVRSGPISYENLIIFGSDDYNLYCYSRDSQQIEWIHRSTFWVRSDPVVYASNNWYHDSVCIGLGFNMTCLDISNGETRWQHPTETEVWTTPLIHGDVLVFANSAGRLFCLNIYSGSIRWFKDYPVEREFRSPTEPEKLCSGATLYDPIAFDDHSFLLTYESPNDSAVTVINYETGEEIWRTRKSSIVRPALCGDWLLIPFSYSLDCYRISQ